MEGESGYEFMLIDLPIKKAFGGNKQIEEWMAQLTRWAPRAGKS